MACSTPALSIRRDPIAWGLAALTLTSLVAVGAAAAPLGDPTVVKIVSSLPRTGSANAQSTTTVHGIRMAIEENGGRAGRFRVVYEDWDDASAKKGDWDPEVEAANAEKAVADPDVMVIIGPYNSGAAKISMPITNKARLAMISPANSYPGLTKPGGGEPDEPAVYRPSGVVNYFRVVPADDLQGRAAAHWMRQLGARSVYVLDDRSLYGKGIADVLVQAAPAAGLQLLGREGMDPKAQEYRSLMTKIKALDPDFVFFGGTTQTNAGQLAKDMVATSLRAKLMLPDGCYEEAFLQAAGSGVLDGRTFVTFGGLPPERLQGQGAAFVQRYRERFGGEPEGYAVYGYVAARAALDVIADVGRKDRDAVRAALLRYGQKDGALGTWRFDAQGDTTMSTMAGLRVEGGAFVFATLLGADTKASAAQAETTGAAPATAQGWAPAAADPPQAPGTSEATLVGQQLLIGVSNGMVYALIALGYSLVYGILEFINFAHGDVFMLASFFALTLVGCLDLQAAEGMPLALGLALVLLLTMAFAGGVNLAIDRIVYRPLRRAPKLAPLVSAIGVSFLLQNVGMAWGALPMAVFGGGGQPAAPKAFPALLPTFNLFGADAALSLRPSEALCIVASLLLMLGLVWLVGHTRLGLAMRALAQDPDAARLQGVDVDRVVALTFLLGGALAGVAAFLFSLSIQTISYQMGYQNGLYAFTAAVIGGIGRIPGAVVGGLLLGVVRALSDQYIGAQWQPAILFGILIALLVFRPTGLLGNTAREKV